MKIKKILFIVCAILLISACDSEKHIRTYTLSKIKKNENNQFADNKKTHSIQLSWEKPKKWIESKGSSMRIASFSVPYSNGIADVSLIKLQGVGGGILSNVNRWRGQLSLNPLTLVEVQKQLIKKQGEFGFYNIIEIINNEIDSVFLCSIIPYKDQTIFAKASFKSSAINELKNDFIKFCSSIKMQR